MPTLIASPATVAHTAPRATVYRVRRALHAHEFEQAHALRRAVFCAEQGVFTGDDRDAIDEQAQLLVALHVPAGERKEERQVVGTVRIHAPEPGLWWGSRLAVHAAFRRQAHLGAGLIRLAVCSAQAQGCQRFLAHVQAQNAPLFERLHWVALRTLDIHGRPHVEMQADLRHYPPLADAGRGFLTPEVSAR
ncbi:MAG: GNAT family N-acetyltransferase [Comamonadaceae bacterium]|nr:MAG: GNAT family N-acetyltransferase [Comamonadaceae bacterium]